MKGAVRFFCPEGKSPLRGLVRRADMSQRDRSTSWICP
jgi:hypothetical protein